MSGEVIDFKNLEYKKVRIVMGELASFDYWTQLVRDGWAPEVDAHFDVFMKTPSAEKVHILTFWRPRKTT